MKLEQHFQFPAIAVYREQGDYIVHNHRLNTWIVLDHEEYKYAAEMIYEHKRPIELISTKEDEVKVKRVMNLFRLYNIGYQDAPPRDYELLDDLHSQGMGKVAPKSVYFVTTYKCNLSCVYCYADSSPERSMKGDLSTEEAMDMIMQIKDLGTQTLIFTGGEAFLRKDTLTLMKYAKSIGLKVNVITNGTLVTSQEKANQIAEICDYVTLSLDSMEKEEHEANRGVNTWEKVIRALEFLQIAGAKLKINQTITKNNPNSIDGVIEYAKKLGANINITPIAELGRGNEEDHGLNYADRAKVSNRLLQEEVGNVDASDCKTLSVRQGEHNRHCGHGTSEFSIDAKGNVFPCKLLHNPLFHAGSIRNKPLREIWGNSYIFEQSRSTTVSQLPGCAKCTFKESCGGGCRAFHWGATNDIRGTTHVDCSGIRKSIRKKMWMYFRSVRKVGVTS